MFRRFLLFSGVHGKAESLAWLRCVVQERRPDALLFAGGVLPWARPYGNGTSPWSLTLKQGRFVEEFFATLGKLGVFSAVIPAPGGEPLEEFLRLGLQAELAFPNIHIVHATLVEEGGLGVCGLGGSLAEKELLGIDSYSRPTAEYFLRSLWKTNQSRKVMLLPAPPPGRLGGLEGEALIGDLIDHFHPNLCVVAGSSARRGGERQGRVLVVNPGCLADGSAAWLDWSHGDRRQLEFLDLRPETVVMRPLSKEDVRLRAYLRWEAAGKREGDPLRYWLEAENEVRCSC